MDILNDAQRQAVHATDGPLAIIAGPGTGKTKTLVAKIQHLLANGLVPERILALTFTKKAANEMAVRLGNSRVQVATFHALCFTLLKECTTQPPVFITEQARVALIKSLPKPAALKGVSTRELGLLVSRAKNQATVDPPVRVLVTTYDNALHTSQLYDFDDLLLQVHDALRDNPAWRAKVQARFSHILVDEFQDTNALQYQLLNLLRGTDNLCVIGDPLQSIYGFRGATADMFAKFKADLAHARTVTLTTNYRSAPQIVALANAVYPKAPALQPHDQTAGEVAAIMVLNEYSEANFVLNSIQRAIGGSDLLHATSDEAPHSLSLRDFAVLYRSRRQARTLQKVLDDSGIPYQVVGEGSPYDDPQVQTVLQLLARHADAARAVAIKDMTPAQATAYVQTLPNEPPSQLATRIMNDMAMAPTPALRQLQSALYRFADTKQAVAYFDDLALQEFYDPRADAVTLLTIHAAKGLEFAHVFLVAAEQGSLPSKQGDLTEEKRLFYVAVTRAKRQLDILYAQKRTGQPATPSQFITELPLDILPRHTDTTLPADTRRAQKRQAKRAQQTLF